MKTRAIERAAVCQEQRWGSAERLLVAALWLVGGAAEAQSLSRAEAELVDEGFRVFTEETFGGNGRTCATCHIPEASYTIGPRDIARMSARARALVLATNVPGLEHPTLVTQLALFNAGPGTARSLTPDGPFRSVMSVTALELTSRNEFPFAGPHGPQLGWAGDGAPRGGFHHGNVDPDADGSIRAFANGAIAQHATKSLARIAGVDFRFATDRELDALDAFQKWLGRRAPSGGGQALPLASMTFADPQVEAGKALFMSDKTNCNLCHTNGGANLAEGLLLPVGIGSNFNQEIGIERERARLSAEVGVAIPEDEGGMDTPPNGREAHGKSFNLPSIIEAPRKHAFFHNSAVVGEVEDAIGFYFTESFLKSADFPLLPAHAAHCRSVACLEEVAPRPIETLGAFLRALSAFHSLGDCERLLQEAIERVALGMPVDVPVRHCLFALDDTVRVLSDVQLHPRPHADVRHEAACLRDALKSAWHAGNCGRSSELQVLWTRVSALRGELATVDAKAAR